MAYLALAIGAGLSITFNVVDTLDTRGAAVDRWDIVTAVAFPSIVVLMVEMFVSQRWTGQGRPMQVIRWTGTLTIGGIAMLVSWTHGHDFLSTRGQSPAVSIAGPLSIDLLAIMATALILSGRAVPVVVPPRPLTAGDVLKAQDQQRLSTWMSEVTAPVEPEEPAKVMEDYQQRMAEIDQHAPDTIPDWMTPPGSPAVARRAPTGKLTDGQRAEVGDLMIVGRHHAAYPVADLRTLLAAWYKVSTKTIQRVESPKDNVFDMLSGDDGASQ